MTDWEEWARKIDCAYGLLDSTDYYTILSVSRDADVETIRKAYYLRARQLHPDRVRNFPEPTRSRAVSIFKRVAEAYRILSDPAMRKVYDEMLREGEKRIVFSDRMTLKPKTEFDFLTTEAGKRYYQAAREALEAGNRSRAELNLRLAIQYEGEKKELLELLRKVQG